MNRLSICVVALILAAAIPVAAQISAGGSVRGTIRDEQGGVLPGVTVTATSPGTPRPTTAVTDSQGVYRLMDLQPGIWNISAEIQGFSKYERRGVEVRAALNIEVDITMKVGALSSIL